MAGNGPSTGACLVLGLQEVAALPADGQASRSGNGASGDAAPAAGRAPEQALAGNPRWAAFLGSLQSSGYFKASSYGLGTAFATAALMCSAALCLQLVTIRHHCQQSVQCSVLMQQGTLKGFILETVCICSADDRGCM